MILRELIELVTGDLALDRESDMRKLLNYTVLVHTSYDTQAGGIESVYVEDADRTVNIDVGR